MVAQCSTVEKTLLRVFVHSKTICPAIFSVRYIKTITVVSWFFWANRRPEILHDLHEVTEHVCGTAEADET